MNWTAAAQGLDAIMARYYAALAQLGVADASADYGRPITVPPAELARITAQIGDRVQGITATQRDMVARLVNTYAGDRPALIAALQDAAGLGPDRAALIARTEVANVLNQSTVAAAVAVGHDQVYVTDGDGDPECAGLDGTTQTVAWAQAHPLGHPNCQRRIYLATESE